MNRILQTERRMLNIYDIAGSLLLSVPETEGCEHVAELMNSDYVKLSFVLDTGNDLPQGAYIVYKGETYRLFEPYTPVRTNEVEYRYEPHFHSKVMGWVNKPFFFLQTSEGVIVAKETDWTLTGTVSDFLNRIVASIEDETGEEYSFDYDLSLIGGKTIQFQGTSIIDGLNAIAEAWDTEWWVSGTVIHLSRCAHSSAIALTVGTNVGVPTVTRNDEGYFTRFYAFGSSRNIPQDYTSGSSASHVVKKRLTLPPLTCPQGYKDVRSGLTPVEINTKVLIFDDIYPKSSLTISSVRYETRYHYDENGNRIPTGQEVEGVPVYDTYRVYFFSISGFTFDLESIIEGETLSIHLESGNLAGWDFELAYHPEDDEFEIIFDESTGYVVPNVMLAPEVGDNLVLFNIVMPPEYTASAEADLEDRLDEKMAEFASNLSTYQVNSYPVAFAAAGISLTVGRNVNFTSGELSHSTRVLAITEKLDDPYTVSVRLGEKATKRTTKRLQEEIVDVNKAVEAVATKLLNVSRARRNWKNTGELLDMVFDPDGYFDPQNIRPQSIETMMLKVGTRSQQLSFNSTIEPNYGGDPNEVRVSAGSLAHYGMGDTVMNWNIGASSATLSSTGPYYIYARCSKTGATGQVVFSQDQIMADADPDYYNFLLGVIHSVESGVRWISLTYGATAINGRYITTGRITSQDGLNYFDLDQNQLMVGDADSSLDWNVTAPGQLTIKGTLVQSPGGTTFPLPCFRGAYTAGTTYYKGDQVTYNGESWIYINNTPAAGQTPVEGAYWTKYASGGTGSDGTTYMINSSTSITVRKADASYDPAYISVRLVRKIGIGDPTNINFYYRAWVSNDGVTFFMYSQGGPSSSINYYFPSNPNMVAIYFEVYLDNGYSQMVGRAGVAVLNQADLAQVGPSVVYTGEFSASKIYYNNSLRRDIVKYSDQYYIFKGTNGTSGAWSVGNWDSFGANFESVATGLLFAELAFVDNLGVRVLQGAAMPVGDLSGTVATITPNGSLAEAWVYDTYYNTDDLASSDWVNYKALRNNIDKYPNGNPEDWTTVGVAQPQKRKDCITLSGTSGSANITCDGITIRIDYSTGGLGQTAEDFVVLYAADWLTGGVVLTSVDEDLFFESTIAGQNFTGNTTITNEPNFYRGSIVVRGNEIWEDNEDNDLYGVVAINRRGYHGGHTRNRFTLIGDGKGKTVLGVVPVDAGGMFKGLNLVQGMPLRMAQMGTTQINALTATEGTMAYDIVTHTLKIYTNAGWRTVQTS